VSHRNTFVGGTCAPPSALLVSGMSLRPNDPTYSVTALKDNG